MGNGSTENGALSEFDRGRLVEQISDLKGRVKDVEESFELENERRRDSNEGVKSALHAHELKDTEFFTEIKTELKGLREQLTKAYDDVSKDMQRTRTLARWIIGLLVSAGLGILAIFVRR